MIPAIPHMALRLWKHVEVVLPFPVGDGGEETFPLVPLVVHEDVVEPARQRALDDLVLLERVERLAEVAWHAWDVHALGEHVVDVALLRRARVELPVDAVEAGPEERSLSQVGIARRVDRAVLEAAAAGDAHEAGPVLPAVVLVDRRPEDEVPEALVR